MVKVRFAPSPTGKLHIGNARVAILNWMFARSHNGEFLLRMDDTDTQRSTEEYAQGIQQDMAWLGLNYDSFARQSDNIDQYDAALEKLKGMGRVYACYETAEELDLKRSLQQAQGKPPVYDRASLHLSDAEKAEKEAQGIRPYWRFLLNDTAIEWDDLSRGKTHFGAGHLSDPVLIRADGRYLYTMSSVVDDGTMNITHIIRGDDHAANTAVQVQLFEALGYSVPIFAHMPLISGKEGAKFSKRLGTGSLEDIRGESVENITVVSALCRLGSSITADGTDTLETLKSDFDITKFGRANPKFDIDDLFTLNTKVLHHLPYDAVQNHISDTVDATLWNIVNGNLETLNDLTMWENIIKNDVETVIEDAEFITTALRLLPVGDIVDTTWKTWTTAIKDETGRKGKQLFMPLRLAITGKDFGPEMGKILPLIGRDKTVKRLTK